MEQVFRHSEQTTSLGKGLALLDVLTAADGPLRLGSLAARAGQPRSTTHRLVRMLVSSGVATQNADGTYALGLRLLELGRRAVAGTDLRATAIPVLRELRDRTGETAHLGIADGDEVVYLEKVESRHAVRMTSEVGGRNPAHCTALGKAILSQRPPETRCPRTLPSRTDRTHTTARALAHDLRRVRQRGYAIDDEENEPGLRCVAAPVLDAAGHPVAAVSISGPTIRITADNVRYFGQAVIFAAASISRALGHREATTAA